MSSIGNRKGSWQEVTGPASVSNGGPEEAEYKRDPTSPDAPSYVVFPGESVTIDAHESRYFAPGSLIHVTAIEDLGRRRARS